MDILPSTVDLTCDAFGRDELVWNGAGVCDDIFGSIEERVLNQRNTKRCCVILKACLCVSIQ
jgi:hypothetical protein